MPEHQDSTPALDLVAALEQRLDLESWEDPDFHWYSSSVSVNHKGKKYHTHKYCTPLDRVKIVEYDLPYSAVTNQLCCICNDMPVTKHRAIPFLAPKVKAWLRDIREVAARVDAGLPVETTAIHRLQLVTNTTMSQAAHADDRIDKAAGAMRDTLAQILAPRHDDESEQHVHAERIAAMRLMERPPVKGESHHSRRNAPQPATGTTALGGTYYTSEAWGPMVEAVAADSCTSYADARVVALQEVKIGGRPLQVGQLAGITVTATEVGQTFGLDDLCTIWAGQAVAELEAVLSDWADRAERNLRLSRTIGRLRVSFSGTPVVLGDAGHVIRQALNGTLYPAHLTADGEMCVDLPAAVALLVVRHTLAELMPGASIDGDAWDMAQRLIKTGMADLEAYSTALTVITDKAA